MTEQFISENPNQRHTENRTGNWLKIAISLHERTRSSDWVWFCIIFELNIRKRN